MTLGKADAVIEQYHQQRVDVFQLIRRIGLLTVKNSGVFFNGQIFKKWQKHY